MGELYAEGIRMVNSCGCDVVTGSGVPTGINIISSCVCLSGDTKGCMDEGQRD